MIKIFMIFLLFLAGSLQAKIDINTLLKQKDSIFQNDGIFDEKISILNDISTYYYIQDDSSNFAKYAIKAFSLAKKINKKKEVDALNHLAFVYSYRDRKKLSKEYAQEALSLANSINYSKGIAEATFYLGYSVGRKDIEYASKYFIKAINLAKAEGNEFIYALSNTYIGLLFTDIGNYNSAVKYLITARKTFDKLLGKDSSLRTIYYYAEVINYLGNTYRRMEYIKEAKDNYNKYMSLSEYLNNGYGVGISLNNLGIVHTHNSELPQAIESLKKAKEVFEGMGVVVYSGTILNNLATIYSELKDYRQSVEYYYAALNFYKERQDSAGLAMVVSNLADLYLVQGKFKKAESSFQKAILILNGQDREILKACYIGLSRVYDSLNIKNIAYRYYRLYTELKDTIAELTKAEEIGAVTENYKNEKMIEEQKRREQDQQEIKAEKMNRKYNLQYMAILIFLLFIFAFIIIYNKFRISTAKIESIVFVALLFLFEFIMVFFDPYVNRITSGEPVFNLMINGGIALALMPLDTYLEKIIRHRKGI